MMARRHPPRRWGALALSLLLVGCAKKGGLKKDAPVEPPPAWSTKAGRREARMDLAEAMVDAGTSESALKLIGQMRADGQGGPELDVIQARALRDVGLLDDAADMLEGVIDRHPRHTEARNEYAILLMDRHDVDGAITQLELAAKQVEDDAEIWNNLGFALMSAGRADEAVDALRRSLRLDSSQARTRNNLGFALVAAGRADEAFRVFRAGAGAAAAHYNVGVGLELRGEAEAARGRYARAVEADPRYQPARSALERLERLEAAAAPADPPDSPPAPEAP